MASLTLVCPLTMAITSAPAQEECPCIKAAKELGVKGETFDRFKGLCEQLGTKLAEVDERPDMKKLGQEAEAAAKTGDEKKAKSLRVEQAKLYKPTVRQFHEEVRTLFEPDLYRAFKVKLPPFYQPFPETLRGAATVTEYLRYAIPADKQEEFRKAWRQAMVLLGRSPHCLGQEMTQCVEDPRLYTIRLHWDSAGGHQEDSKQSPDHAKARECVKAFGALLTSEPHHHYRIIDQ